MFPSFETKVCGDMRKTVIVLHCSGVFDSKLLF
jgi:hypothetical protein